MADRSISPDKKSETSFLDSDKREYTATVLPGVESSTSAKQPCEYEKGDCSGDEEMGAARHDENGTDTKAPMRMEFSEDCSLAEKRKRKDTDCSKNTQSTASSTYSDLDELDPGKKAVSKQETSLDPCAENDCVADDDDSSASALSLSMPSYFRRVKRAVGCVLLFGIFWLLVVLLGAEVEERDYSRRNSTDFLYQGSEVCGMTTRRSETPESTESFLSTFEAHEAGYEVGHCGDCGHCSSYHDMDILARTRKNLTDVTARCAFKIFIGKDSVRKCMEERVGFTPECNECWLENIACTFKSCKFTCTKYKLFRQDNNEGDDLSDCIKCDERMCGPAFLKCSGSNRRRMGIVSDIGRDEKDEQCNQTDIDWLQQVSEGERS